MQVNLCDHVVHRLDHVIATRWQHILLQQENVLFRASLLTTQSTQQTTQH